MEGLDKSLPVSLYIHIPFCKRKCDYCAFYSRSPKDEEIERYFSLLKKEVEAVRNEVGKSFETIFIGGGNPALLGFDRIKELLEISQEYGRAKEVTVECNPENITEELRVLENLADRISVGIQSMNQKTLDTLGRALTVERNERALSLLSSLPFRWNADIITAVPFQSVEDTLSDIKNVASYNPGHISFYCLTFEEGTPLTRRLAPVGEEKEMEMLLEGWKALEELGYEHYEVSNFAKKGEECLHNSIYWNLGQYIGVGPSAESAVGYRKMVSMRNRETIEDYLSSPSFDCTRMSQDETEESYLLTALRTKKGINKKEYKNRFGRDFDELYSERISLLSPENYISNEEAFSVTEKGMLVLNTIILTLAMAI